MPAYLKGGAAVSGPGVETLDMLAVVVPPETLLSMLDPVSPRGGVGGGSGGKLFPALDRFVDGVRWAGGKQAGRKLQRPRVRCV